MLYYNMLYYPLKSMSVPVAIILPVRIETITLLLALLPE